MNPDCLPAVGVAAEHGFPATPPPEVLDALDRAARILDELDAKHVTLSLVRDEGTGRVRVSVARDGESALYELSPSGLLSLLDGGVTEVDE